MGADPLLAPFDGLTVGDRFQTRERTVTDGDVMTFAAHTGDRHPVHTDDAWARQSPFGGRIAHGMLVLSYAIGLMAFPPEHVIALRGLRDVVFKRPVHIDETICVRGRIEDKRKLDDDRGLVTLRADVHSPAGATYCRMRLDALWRLRCDAATPVRQALTAHGHA